LTRLARVSGGCKVKSLKHILGAALALGLSFPLPTRGAAVTVSEGTIELPTYPLGVEDPNPAFPLLRGHNIYPYTLLDDLTDRLERKTYRAIFLENDFLKATILPQMGGRLYSLFDKVSGREVFYRNNVVKYGLVALRGAWISGGIEFNFPDGHTVVTVSPVASTTRENPDGSATVVVGDVDQVTGMHWEVAFTLRPGQSRLEQRVTLFNPTPLTNPYWYWANAAVPATDDMQFIYPMCEAYPHSRTEIWTYPVWKGVDYSWYKNVRHPTSLFGRQVHRNFYGAYYHNSDYGVVHVADFRQVPGKKIWTWGVARDGLIWTDLLTDRDGPYNEIQSGRYETQLNYEFMPPRRVESWTEYWYPVRGLRNGFVEATSQLALNVFYVAESGMSNQRIDLLLSPTEEIPALQIRASLGARTLKEFGPLALKALEARRFSLSVNDLESARRALTVDIESADKQLLLHWSAADPLDGNADFVAAAGKPASQPKPVEKMTVEELFLHGLEQEKDGGEESAQKTYDEVLRRDPGYISALLKKAWWNYRAADFPGAEAIVARALSRNAFDPAVHFAAGVIYGASGRRTLAADALWASVHYGGPAAPALAQLGEIAIQRKSYLEAARLLRESLSYNRDDALALTDLAVALRLGGKTDDAAKAADAALQKMPLLAFALAEAWRVQQAGGTVASLAADPHEVWKRSFEQNVQAYLEAAAWYRSLDDFESADAVLQAALKDLPGQALSPLVYYYLASDARSQGKKSEADDYAARAASASVEKVFPQRIGDAIALADAVLNNSLNPHGLYELGNFLFAHGRYEGAAHLWLQALGQGFDYSVLERNLGVFAWRVEKNLPAAVEYYSKAIQLVPDDYRLYRDLDEIYFQMGDTSRRAKLFAGAAPAVLERDTIRARRALLLTQQKQFDQALALFGDHRFKPWEGGEIIRQVFVRANIEEGRQYLEARKFTQAEKAFRRALEYPPNLGVGKPDKPHDEDALYWLGQALQVQGRTEEARAAWQQAVGEGEAGDGPSRVYAALALRRLGKSTEAERILSELVKVPGRGNPGAGAWYVAGLAERALNHPDAAGRDLRRALKKDPLFWQARLESEREPAIGSRK
jgi:tetratricopeptide (TPR) repeat protein